VRAPDEQDRFLNETRFEPALLPRIDLRWPNWSDPTVTAGILGALAEIVCFVLSWPRSSTAPPTRLEALLGYTQWPGAFLFVGVLDRFGPGMDAVPPPIVWAIILVIAALALLLQSAMLALPIWLVLRVWRMWRS
jgi:hypothetical protein